MKNFSVIVGNIGNVHNGNNGGAAKIVYNDYVRQSKGGAGRMSNEPVILLCDDELIKEYSPNEGFYFVEFTDTFGGEANYSWARRYKVKAETRMGAMRKAAADMGVTVRKDFDTGCLTRYNVPGACICAFVSEFEHEENYSNVKTI